MVCMVTRLETRRENRIFKKALYFMALCACGTLALLFLSNASHFGLVRGATSQQQQAARTATPPATSRGTTKKTIHLERAPVRRLEDPHSSFSAVAVDVARNEIVLSDENLAQIVVYGRLDNTPAQAALTEPKRVIGGSRTKINLNCGTYVDPFSGDIYSVNGDTDNGMTVFSREAKGHVPANRTLTAPHRVFVVRVNAAGKELYLSIWPPPVVVVSPKTAQKVAVLFRIV